MGHMGHRGAKTLAAKIGQIFGVTTVSGFSRGLEFCWL